MFNFCLKVMNGEWIEKEEFIRFMINKTFELYKEKYKLVENKYFLRLELDTQLSSKIFNIYKKLRNIFILINGLFIYSSIMLYNFIIASIDIYGYICLISLQIIFFIGICIKLVFFEKHNKKVYQEILAIIERDGYIVNN